MDQKPKDGEPAFPVHIDSRDDGMTLREYYAGKAMAAILVSPATFNGGKELNQQEVAKLAVWMAEALIARLNERE
jgi:hypothetical protein